MASEFLQTEDVRTSAATEWDNLEASGRQFCKFLESVIRRKIARANAEKDLEENSK
jgi:hypothetical protein